jgi:ABC-type ATPase involved in cell division
VTLMIATHDLARVGDLHHRTFVLSEGCLIKDTGAG